MTITTEYSDEIKYNGGMRTFAFFGNFGGGTLTIEASFDDGTTWIPLKKNDGEILEVVEDEVHIVTITGCLLRYHVTGGSGFSIEAVIK